MFTRQRKAEESVSVARTHPPAHIRDATETAADAPAAKKTLKINKQKPLTIDRGFYFIKRR